MEMVDSLDELQSPHDQCMEKIFQIFEMLDAKITSPLNKIIQFKKEVSPEEQKA